MGTFAETMPDRRTLESAVASACRAPSLHNSQPWRWVLGTTELRLFSDPDRILPATDPSGRQMVLSCGAVLHHLQTALLARGWAADIDRLTPASYRDLLATLRFRRTPAVSEHALRMAAAIECRRTERLPMLAPPRWPRTVARLRDLVEGTGAQLGVIDERQRPALETLSRRISGLRRTDPDYEAELTWWTGHAVYPEGVPADALPPAHRTVATDREFPAGTAGGGRDAPDRAALLLLSTSTDTRLDWLCCGEALSVVLLLCADEGLASCPVTHLTESVAPRAFLRRLGGGHHVPQVLIRVGVGAPGASSPPTPRRPVSEILVRDRPTQQDRT